MALSQFSIYSVLLIHDRLKIFSYWFFSSVTSITHVLNSGWFHYKQAQKKTLMRDAFSKNSVRKTACQSTACKTCVCFFIHICLWDIFTQRRAVQTWNEFVIPGIKRFFICLVKVIMIAIHHLLFLWKYTTAASFLPTSL